MNVLKKGFRNSSISSKPMMDKDDSSIS